MPLPKVTLVLGNGLLGLAGLTSDGVAAIIASSDEPAHLAIGTPVLITSASEALDTHGIADTTNFYRQIKLFFDTAGEGAELYVMAVARTSALKDMVDVTKDAYAKKLLDYAGGRVRLLGVSREPAAGYEGTTSGGIDKDVLDALVTGQALAETYATDYKPLRILIEAFGYTDTPADLEDLKGHVQNRCCIVLGAEASGKTGAMGLFLGRLAAIPVQRNAGRVKDGPLPVDAAYIGTKKVDSDLGTATLNLVHDKGFIFMRNFPGISGYFFNDDPTATSDTDDYNSVARGRVIDKACVIAYQTYVTELLDEVPITSTGQLDPGFVKYLEAKLERQIELQMAGQISAVSVFVDPNQDVVATDKTSVVLRITPVGYNKEIEVLVGFNNPNNV